MAYPFDPGHFQEPFGRLADEYPSLPKGIVA